MPLVAAYSTPSAPHLNDPLSIENGKATLSWDRPDNGGNTIGGYNLYRSTSPGEERFYKTIFGENNLTFVDLGLTNGVSYYYYVKAVNDAGEGAASN
jgi:hypothetical protein